MALLVGMHFQEAQRMDRGRMARAVKRSVKTVQRALGELRARGWIEYAGGGNGTPGYIRVLDDVSWRHSRPKMFVRQTIKALRRMPYARYLQTQHWQDIRALALRRAGNKCQLCSAKEALEVHHNSYEYRGEEHIYPEDLVVLCEDCHSRFHDKTGESK